MKTSRRYSGRDGYVASIDRLSAGLDQITGASRDWLVSPIEGKLVKRRGRQIQGEALPYAPVGLLEFKSSMAPRRILEIASSVLTDGYPTWMVLFVNEGVESRLGQLLIRSTNGVTQAQANHTFGEEFSSTTYPATGGAGAPVFKMIPLPYITQGSASSTRATGMTRCSQELHRRYVAGGSRSVWRSNGRTYLPNFFGSPFQWDEKWNDTTATVTNTLRAGPWGIVPPLYPPDCPASGLVAASSTSDRNWRDGDRFYASVIFEHEDGSYSQPFLPSARQALIANDAGLFVVGSIGTQTYYRSILWDNIPVGGPGIVRKHLCVSRKINVNVSSAEGFNTGQVTDIFAGQLFVKASIPNSQTQYIDADGDHASLLPNDLVVNFKRIWPLPSRYMFQCDARVCLMYMRLEGPVALLAAPTGTTSSRDLNLVDDAALVYSTTQYFIRVAVDVSGVMTLELARSIAAAAPSVEQFTVSATSTLLDLVYAITVKGMPAGPTRGEWAMALRPGVDGNILAKSALQATSRDVASCVTAIGSSTITHASSGFADVASGMGISGVGVPANTFVGLKSSNGALVMVDGNGVDVLATANGTVTLTFFIDTGDEAAIGGAGLGWIRAYCPAFPAPLPFKASFLDTYARTDKQRIIHTTAAPGTAAMSPNAWVNAPSNFNSVPATAGIAMGGAPLTRGAIACYSKSIYTMEARKGGNTGEDQDYHLYPLNPTRGCIAPYSIVAGDGWVGYLTREGYVVTDGVREQIITYDLNDVSSGRGVLADEISSSVAALAKDDDGAGSAFSGFYASLEPGRLRISYRIGGVRFNQIYDYSQGIESSGLGEVLRDGERPYGWSAPTTENVMMASAIDSSSGVKIYGCVGTTPGTIGDGRVDLLETGGFDDADRITLSGLTNASTIITGVVGQFARVAVGARLGGTIPTGFTAGDTVLSKAADDSSVTMSAGTGVHAGFAATFFGLEVDPVAYFATDQVDDARRNKMAIRATARYKNPAGVMKLLYSRTRGSSGTYEVDLPATGVSDQSKKSAFLPLAAQSPGETMEFGVRESGGNLTTMPEFFGVDVDLELMENPT